MDRTNEFLSVLNILKSDLDTDTDNTNTNDNDLSSQSTSTSIPIPLPSLFLQLAIKTIQITNENDGIVQRMVKL